MGTNTETYNETMCREWEPLEHPVLNGMAPSNPSAQGAGKPAELRARGDGKEACTYELRDSGSVHRPCTGLSQMESQHGEDKVDMISYP